METKLEYSLLLNTPASVAILEGPEHRFTLANDSYRQLAGDRELIGKTVKQAFPELKGQGFYELLDTVYRTKRPYVGKEAPAMLSDTKTGEPHTIYVDLTYNPILNEQGDATGIFVHATDVTEAVINRRTIEDARERYKMVLSSVDEGFCIIDLQFDAEGSPVDYCYVEVNGNFEEQTGLRDVIGKTGRQLVPDLEQSWFELYGSVAKTGKSIRFSQSVQSMGRWFDVQATKVGGESGNQVALLFKDVTERKRRDLEQALLTKQLTEVLEGTFDGFVVVDSDWTIVRVNKAFEELSKQPRDVTIGKKLWELFPDTHSRESRYFKRYEEVMQSRKPRSFVEHYEPLGTWSEVSVYPSANSGLSVFVRDISSATMAEQEFHRQAALVETIMNTSVGCLCRIDSDGLVRYMNQAGLRTTGYGLEEVIGKSLHDLVHHTRANGEPYPEDECPLQNAFVHHKPLPETETTYFRKNGEAFPVVLTSTPIIADVSLGSVVEFRDISEFKRVQAERERSERRYTALFNSNTVALATASTESDVLEANDTFLKLFGYTKADLRRGLNAKQLTAKGDTNSAKMYKSIRERGESPPLERRYVRKDGTEFPALVGSAVLPDGSGQFVSFIIDTSETEQLKELNRTKDEFIALASHQLRTPATAVKQYLGIIMEGYAGDVSPDQLQYLAVANGANDRQLTIIEDLLKTARIDTRGFALTLTPHDLRALVLDTIKQYKPMVETKSQTISFSGGKDPLVVPFDSTELGVVIANLIENASKYSPPNTVISIQLRHTATSAILSVSDRGVGIDTKDLDKVFEKFTRIHNELSDSTSGSGLGLYWVKRIIDIHKGTLTIESELGKGTTFTIRLKR